MNGNYNRYNRQIPREKITPMPGMKTNCDSDVRIMTIPTGDNERNFNFDSMTNVEEAPLGMAYVPWQMWGAVYSFTEGFERGTIFPELDLPFMIERCRQ